mmetsp:Transcript_102046/g.288151  ORF Transcript_102046/g.288151 Transcript_102046/m.288151 type:complete len:377 (+) Transcript_102046:132-1262(+)
MASLPRNGTFSLSLSAVQEFVHGEGEKDEFTFGCSAGRFPEVPVTKPQSPNNQLPVPVEATHLPNGTVLVPSNKRQPPGNQLPRSTPVDQTAVPKCLPQLPNGTGNAVLIKPLPIGGANDRPLMLHAVGDELSGPRTPPRASKSPDGALASVSPPHGSPRYIHSFPSDVRPQTAESRMHGSGPVVPPPPPPNCVAMLLPSIANGGRNLNGHALPAPPPPATALSPPSNGSSEVAPPPWMPPSMPLGWPGGAGWVPQHGAWQHQLQQPTLGMTGPQHFAAYPSAVAGVSQDGGNAAWQAACAAHTTPASTAMPSAHWPQPAPALANGFWAQPTAGPDGKSVLRESGMHGSFMRLGAAMCIAILLVMIGTLLALVATK